jgi:pimeloyl-ACP methyl ester carboxylesterase
VVLLPGFALDSSVMAAACEPAFTRANSANWANSANSAVSAVSAAAGRWQRIYLDLPGTGGSSAGEPTSDWVLTAVQETVTDLIGTTPYLLVGHSYGGYLATGLARRDPARVAGLFLVTCGLRIRPADRDLSGVLSSTPDAGWLDGVPGELHEHFQQAIGHQTRVVADRVATALDRRGPIDEQYLDALRPDGYRLTDEPEPEGEAEPQAADSLFAGPVHLLAGRRDRIAGYRDPFAALAGYPRGSYTVLAEAGHYLPFEQPELFAVSILDWLTAVDSGTTRGDTTESSTTESGTTASDSSGTTT